MGMYPMPTPTTCPGCGRSLGKLPAALRVAVKDFPAEVTYGTDPECGARWHVWDKTSPIRRLAQRYVDAADLPDTSS